MCDLNNSKHCTVRVACTVCTKQRQNAPNWRTSQMPANGTATGTRV